MTNQDGGAQPTSSADDEIRRLHFEVVGAIYSRQGTTPIDCERNGDDARDAASAVLKADTELLRVYASHAHTTKNTFGTIRRTYDLLTKHKVANPSQYLTVESVTAYNELSTTLIDIRKSDENADTDGIGLILLMAGDDLALVEKTIEERRPTTGQQLMDLLTDIKSAPRAISSGTL